MEQGFSNIPVSITEFEFNKETKDKSTEQSSPEPGEEPVLLTINNKELEETVDRNILSSEEYDPTLDLSHYQYPPLELLEEHSSGNPKVTQEELEENNEEVQQDGKTDTERRIRQMAGKGDSLGEAAGG